MSSWSTRQLMSTVTREKAKKKKKKKKKKKSRETSRCPGYISSCAALTMGTTTSRRSIYGAPNKSARMHIDRHLNAYVKARGPILGPTDAEDGESALRVLMINSWHQINRQILHVPKLPSARGAKDVTGANKLATSGATTKLASDVQSDTEISSDWICANPYPLTKDTKAGTKLDIFPSILPISTRWSAAQQRRPVVSQHRPPSTETRPSRTTWISTC
jgi:hypothetical protein